MFYYGTTAHRTYLPIIKNAQMCVESISFISLIILYHRAATLHNFRKPSLLIGFYQHNLQKGGE